jgi:hypothetical protein
LTLQYRKQAGFQIALIALPLFFCAATVYANILNLTIINATFSAPCVGGGSTCTEVINGSAVFNTASGAFTNASLGLTGTLAASLNSFAPAPFCVSPDCLQGGGYFYDSGVLPAHDPIEFGSALSALITSSPLPLVGGPNGTALYVPALCGGDQPLCNKIGSFPAGSFDLTSGSYTLVDITSSVPEPTAGILLVTGAALLGLLRRKVAAAARSR